MKITVLDRISFTVGDIDLTSLNNLGEVSYFDVLSPEEVKKVCYDSQVIVCNKTLITKELMDCLPNLKFIAITATGYNNVDLAYAKQKGILVANVPNYSTVDVAQHVFAFILNYSNRVSEYDLSVKQGDWIKSKTFCYFDKPLVELDGKTLGIIGLGARAETLFATMLELPKGELEVIKYYKEELKVFSFPLFHLHFRYTKNPKILLRCRYKPAIASISRDR